MPEYNLDAINACMRKAQDYKPEFAKISDTFPEGATDPAAYGTLPSSGAVAQAVEALNSVMRKELDAAETKLEQVARALDAVVQSLQNTEHNNTRRVTPV